MKNKDILNLSIRPKEGWREFEKDTEVGYSEIDDTLFISFQGSLSLTDWIYNFLFFTPKGVHLGMQWKWEILDKGVFQEIEKRGFKKVCFLGHSQGAGIGLLAFLYVRRFFLDKEFSLITFGCPKILTLWKFFEERKGRGEITHYQIKTDIVTYLSPVLFQLGKVVKLGKWKMPKVRDHYPSSYRELL